MAAQGDTSTRRRRSNRSFDRGVALVEFALVSLLLFTLLFGIIEFGSAFNDYQSIRQGVREGARGAVVDINASDVSCSLPGGLTIEAQQVLCNTKNRIGVGDDVAVRLEFTDPDGNIGFDEDSVTICAVQLVDPITGFIPAIDNIPLKSEIVMRAEKVLDLPSSAGNTDPTGEGWSWCGD